MHEVANAVLILIDLQQAIRMPYWGPRCNPGAEANIAALLAHWRARRRPVVHVRHDSSEAGSGYRPGQAGNDFLSEFAPRPGERVEAKRTNSAFIGTWLEAFLRASGAPPLVFARVSTSNSVEATVRMAGNLGFATWLAGASCRPPTCTRSRSPISTASTRASSTRRSCSARLA